MTRRLVAALLAASLLAACGGPAPDVVLYVALDREHSEPIVAAYEEATGKRVEAFYDVESNKSVGLRRRLQAEAANPRCDVFWNNEAVQTVLLAEAGLLQPYESPNGSDVPDHLKDEAGLWTGFATRARVLIVNTDAVPEGDRPVGWPSFLEPGASGRAGMAKPLTGTTAAHAGVVIARDGWEAYRDLLAAMRANGVHFGPGNAHLMRLVRTGELAFGWTDTDDYRAAETGDFPVAMIVPGQQPGGEGLVTIPNTVSMVAGAPHPEAARELIDFLLSRKVEKMLAHGPSVQIPVRDDVERPDHVLRLSDWRVAEIDWGAAGRAYADHADDLEAVFNQ